MSHSPTQNDRKRGAAMVVPSNHKMMPVVGGNNRFLAKLVLSVVLFFAFTFVVLFRSSDTALSPSSSTPQIGDVKSSPLSSNGAIVQGSVQSIQYYHCSAKASSNILDIVLLHGAKFTKENWKTSGILERLCQNERVRVTALDLPVTATFETLMSTMEHLANSKPPIVSLPIAALVTPSASGKAIVSAISTNQAQKIPQITHLWVPVASGSVKSLTADQLQTVKNEKQSLSIWALHGDQDTMGKEVSNKLKAEAGAVVAEFPGGHPFYLDIPEKFVTALLTKLGAQI